MASGNKQRFSKLNGLFKPKRAASKQVVSVLAGRLAPQLLQEAVFGDLIPAVRQPPDVAQQAVTPSLTVKAEHAAKAATRMSPMHIVCHVDKHAG